MKKLRSKKTQKNKKVRFNLHTRIRHCSHISLGNEVLYVDFLRKGIHGDENNVSW